MTWGTSARDGDSWIADNVPDPAKEPDPVKREGAWSRALQYMGLN